MRDGTVCPAAGFYCRDSSDALGLFGTDERNNGLEDLMEMYLTAHQVSLPLDLYCTRLLHLSGCLRVILFRAVWLEA